MFEVLEPRRRRGVAAAAVIGVALLLGGCFDKFGSGGGFVLDNPTAAPIDVAIDGKGYRVAADSSESVSLSPGAHTIKLPDGKEVGFNVYAAGKGALINPTRSPYVLFYMVYAVDDAAAERFRPAVQRIEVEGKSYIGPVKRLDALFIDRGEDSYSYQPRESYPETKQVGRDAKGNIVTKLFTAREFAAFYEKEKVGEYYDESSITKYQMPVAQAERVDPARFTDAGVRAKAEAVIALTDAYLKAVDAGEQEALRKRFHDVLLESVHAQSAVAAKQSAEQNRLHNDLVRYASHVIGASVAERAPGAPHG